MSITTNTYAFEARTAGTMPVVGKPQGTPAQHRAASAGEAGFQSMLAEQDAATAPETEENGFFSFILGILDVINPLQHIPVISSIYRHITGDEISPMARIAGGALYGGGLGAAAGLADVAVETATGKDIGENVVAVLNIGAPPATDTELAMIETAGGNAPVEIIWNDNYSNNNRIPAVLDQPPVLMPVGPYTQPVRPTGDRVSDNFSGGTGEEFPSMPKPDMTAVLLTQEAPADVPRTDTRPEPIDVTAKMLEALDKYTAMKQISMNGYGQQF